MNQRLEGILPTVYTTPLKTFEYQEPFSYAPEFQRFYDLAVQVGQRSGRVSAEKPLYSDGFSPCAALVVHNTDNKSGALLHLDDGLSGMTEKQLQAMAEIFSGDSTQYVVQLVLGDRSMASELVVGGSFGRYFKQWDPDSKLFDRGQQQNIVTNPTIRIPSGEYCWSIVYRLTTGVMQALVVKSATERELLEFSLV